MLLGLIVLLVFLSLRELRLFIPGLLGAVTLYILSRASYFQLVYNRKWKKERTAGLYVLYYLVLLGIPVFLAITLVGPKLNQVLSDPTATVDSIKKTITGIQQQAGIKVFSGASITRSLDKILEILPSLINSTATLLTNLVLMLFFLYYMLCRGSEMERTLTKLIPLNNENTGLLAAETKRTVKANAIGIPLISIIQGITATIGYLVFGVEEFGLWGFLTGVFAFFPIVGTMIIWVPLVFYLYTTGETWNATGLLVYSAAVTGNIDYIARITIMRRIGDAHPVITVLGVIIGLGLFGFIGLVFGPLLVNYIIVLTRIYINEFTSKQTGDLYNKIPEEPEKTPGVQQAS